MLRPLLLGVLGTSLVANAWFAFSPPRASRLGTSPAQKPEPSLTTTRAAASGAAVPPAASASSAADASAPADPTAPRGLTWRTPRSDEDFRQLAADLRTAGFPPRLIYSLVRELYLQNSLASARRASLPYWQRFSSEVTKEDQAIYRGLNTKLDAILGPDARPSLTLDTATRQRRYGALPDAKIDAIAGIERDYDDMRLDVYRSADRDGFSLDAFNSQREQTKLLNAEKLADLAKILSPAELADYELRNSDASRNLARSLSGIDVTPEQFAALFASRRAMDDANQPITGSVSLEMQRQRQATQNAFYETARKTLPAESFYQLLNNTDIFYRSVAQIPGVTPAGAYQAWSLQQELTAAMTAARTNRPSPEQVQTLYTDINTRLDRAIGAEAAAALRKTSRGRMFNAPQQRPGTTPVPAATIPRG